MATYVNARGNTIMCPHCTLADLRLLRTDLNVEYNEKAMPYVLSTFGCAYCNYVFTWMDTEAAKLRGEKNNEQP